MAWVAEQIPDPVQRLKFLKRTIPPTSKLSQRLAKFLPLAVLSVVIFAMLAWVAFGAARVSKAPALDGTAMPGVPVRAAAAPERAQPPATVWQVEKAGDAETYSNGLRIDNRYLLHHRPRSYVAFPVSRPGDYRGERRSRPAGIVFHTTESRQVTFEAGQNQTLQRIGESLLDYVRRRRAYNFLIDRFGRVYRLVAETDAANHAGYSIWADEMWLYVNLNDSFLGVSFEAQTMPGQTEAGINPAQVRAGAMLTEMLRGRYAIPVSNCVTHAQVSVNPSNMRVGHHTDWASSFPFIAVGLPDNYERALPALWFFGFESDRSFQHTAGTRVQVGVDRAEREMQARAAGAGLQLTAYRKSLQRRYRDYLSVARRGIADAMEAAE